MSKLVDVFDTLDTPAGWTVTDYHSFGCTGELKDRDVEIDQGKDGQTARRRVAMIVTCRLKRLFIPPTIKEDGNQR